MVITFTSSIVKLINPRVEVNMMNESKPKTFREVMKLIFENDDFEIYKIDDDVYLIVPKKFTAYIVYNFTKNIIYYSFSPAGWGVNDLIEKLNWTEIRKIIQSSKL